MAQPHPPEELTGCCPTAAGRRAFLGMFPTPVAAAVAYARHVRNLPEPSVPGPEAAAASDDEGGEEEAASPLASESPPRAPEAARAGCAIGIGGVEMDIDGLPKERAVGGLQLHLSRRSMTGYEGVRYSASCRRCCRAASALAASFSALSAACLALASRSAAACLALSGPRCLATMRAAPSAVLQFHATTACLPDDHCLPAGLLI